MTLAQLAEYVTQKVGQTDDESVAACKDFIAARYRMIWEAGLWADSQALISVTGVTGDTGLIEFPEDVARVIALRNTGTEQDVLGTSIGTIFNFDSSLFSDTGTEAKFIHVKSSPVPFARGVGQVTFDATEVIGTDTATLTIIGGNGRGGILRETLSVPLTGAAEVTTIDFTGKVGSDLDNAGTGRYFLVNSDAMTTLAVCFLVPGSVAPGGTGADAVVNVDIEAADNAAAIVAACVDGAFTGYMSAIADGDTLILTANVAGPLTDAVDGNTGLTITVDTQGALGATTTTETEFDELYLITSELDQPEIPFTNEDDEALGTFSGSIFPEDASATLANVEKVRVYPVPSTAQTYLAHVKLKHAELDDDEDEPALAGIDNALLAFAQADMLERQRQYAKSQLKIKEAQALVEEMLDLEKNQQAYEARIIPADTNGNIYGGYGEFGASGKSWWS